jgi:hydroxyacylglutathione hydrolase
MSLTVETFSGGPIDTNVYLVVDPKSLKGLIVDAPFDVDTPLAERLREIGASVELIVLTHAHWDHIGSTNELANLTGAKVAAHRLCEDRLSAPRSSMIELPFEFAPVAPDRWLGDGDSVHLGPDHDFIVMHLPGHDPGHIALYSEPDRIFLGGDVLFPNGHGRTDIPGASDADMARSLSRVAPLPADVTVYPGHGLPTTIGAERWLQGYR